MKNTRKRVLVIAYFFPPHQEIGSIRLKGLVKYLPKFGWDPVALTIASPLRVDTHFNVVESPYPGDVSSLTRMRKKFGLNSTIQERSSQRIVGRRWKQSIRGQLSRVVRSVRAYPDEQKNWYAGGLEVGARLLGEAHFDALISSSSPVTAHLIARKLKEMHGILWIADLRDLWSQNHYYPYVNLRRRLDRRLEIRTLADADALVTVSKPLSEKLMSLHEKTVYTIPNGFDPEEISPEFLTKDFSITYTGRLYQGNQDPTLLFMTLKDLIDRGLVDARAIKIHFYGQKEDWLDGKLSEFGLDGYTEQHGIVPRETALIKQRESQILLLLNWDNPNEVGIYTGKLFEYLAARRPIIAIGGPQGVVSELLRTTQAGFHVSDRESLTEILRQFHEEYVEFGQVKYRGNDIVQRYSHIEMARAFSEALENQLRFN